MAPGRVVSFHDPDDRPIAKGPIGKPVEFGHKAQLVGNIDGLIVDYQVLVDNPSDAPLLAPAIRRITARFARTPKAVTADQGYGDAQVETDLQALGVKHVVIPRRGPPRPGPGPAAAIPPVHQTGQVAHRLRRPRRHPQA